MHGTTMKIKVKRLGNYCCIREAISIPYSECVSVALFIQHVPFYIPACRLSAVYYIFPTFKKNSIFGKVY